MRNAFLSALGRKCPKGEFKSTNLEIVSSDGQGGGIANLHYETHDGRTWTRQVQFHSIRALEHRDCSL